jgi:hypothetical protein
MDALIPFALSILAVIGFVATIAGVESRDGFDRDGRDDAVDTRSR